MARKRETFPPLPSQGRALKKARIDSRMTMLYICEETKILPRRMYRLENGDYHITYNELWELHRIYRKSVYDMMIQEQSDLNNPDSVYHRGENNE